MIHRKYESLLFATEDIIAHQVNCMGKFNAGLAKEISKAFPAAYNDYMRTCNMMSRKELLGKVKVTNMGDKRIAHLFAQYYYGRDKRYTDYSALTTTLVKLRKYAEQHDLSIALPEGIGCGLAGGDWKVVCGIIEEVFIGYDVTLYNYGGNDE